CSVEDAVTAAKDIDAPVLVVKAQIHAGGRGKAGGVKLVKSKEDVRKEAERLLGSVLVTHQTGPHGKQVNRLYIEEGSAIDREFYLSALVDRETSRVAFVVSTAGGMEIEEVARTEPENCVTSARRTRRRSKRRNTTSTMWRSTAPSAAWSMARGLPWRPWTSSSSTARRRRTFSTSAAAPPRTRWRRPSRSSPPIPR